jgi:hypothetical protein
VPVNRHIDCGALLTAFFMRRRDRPTRPLTGMTIEVELTGPPIKLRLPKPRPVMHVFLLR